MAFAQSHKIEYKDFADVDSLLEIWEDGYEGSVLECEAADDPLDVDIAPSDPTVYIPVIGGGATIKILSVTEGQHRGLYTKDPLKRMVKFYKDNKANPWFLGLVNPEQYSEPYTRNLNYPVIITCNNGFNALKRFKYINGTSKYDTIETFWNVLTRILGKTGLPYQYIYFGTKLSCGLVTVGATETLFHQLSANQLNYYDEKGEPKTYRTVLEGILLSFGLQIRQEQGSIFIYEPSMLADANWSAKRFNGTTYAYVDAVSVSANFDISSAEINWDNEDQALNTRSGFNKQKIRYSSYEQVGAIPEIDVSDEKNWAGGTKSFTQDLYGVYRFIGGVMTVNGLTYGDITVQLSGHKQATDSPEEIYIERFSVTNSGVVFLTIPGFYVGGSVDRYFAVTGELCIHTKHNEFDSAEASVSVHHIKVPIILDIAGTEFSLFTYLYLDADQATLADQWLKFTVKIPEIYLSAGIATLKLYDPEAYSAGNVLLGSSDHILALRIRDIKCRCYKGSQTDKNMIEVGTEDPEYTLTLDEAFENEGPEITLMHADIVNMSDRGGIIKSDGTFTGAWKKTGDAEYSFRLVDLLLRSVSSQYQDTLSVLGGTLEAASLMGVNGGPNFLHTIQDTDYLSTIKHFFAGGRYNDFRRTLNGRWIQIREEDITVTVES